MSERRETARVAVGFLTALAAVISLIAIPASARGDQILRAAPGTPGICDPESLSMGTDASGSITASDTGIATYVGQNMVVGSTIGKSVNEWHTDNGPDGSYAAEAEGTTVVRGNFLAKPAKGFFTLGMVAFGAQYLPPSGTTILTVGGKGEAERMEDVGATSSVQTWPDPHPNSVGIKGSNKTGTVRYTYNGSVHGGVGNIWGYSNDSSHPSIYVYKGSSGSIDSNGDLRNVVIGPVDGKATSSIDASLYQKHISTLSNSLYLMTPTGTVTTGVAPSGSTTYYKYDKSKSYKLNFTSDAPEKVLNLTGNGYSKSQVFHVTQADLDTTGYRGLDLHLTHIPDDATVLINVEGRQIKWQNGWRVWWNNQQIGNGFSTGASATAQRLYTKTAQKILWNFNQATDTTNGDGTVTVPAVTVLGAQTRNGGKNDGLTSSDDPAAALLGTVLIPNGSFDDHVTTNGRVWVGRDFFMNNPTQATRYGNGAGTASAIDMDQERHNLPWNGTVTSSCSAVQWKKTDSTGSYPLEGSGWGIYKNQTDAENRANAILKVYDNQSNDDDPRAGYIQVNNLNPGATYYLREVVAPAAHRLGDTIYRFRTTNTGETVNYPTLNDGSGTSLPTNRTDSVPYITNDLIRMRWNKQDDGGHSLAGSEWKIVGSDGGQYRIADADTGVTSVRVSLGGGTHQIGDTTTATANVTYQNPNAAHKPQVQWRSSDNSIARVDPDGHVTAVGLGTAYIRAYVGNQYAAATYTVSGGESHVTEGTLTILGTNQMLNGSSQSLRLGVNNATIPASDAAWTSSNSSILSVDNNGTVTAHAKGTATITARYQNKLTATMRITVSDSDDPDNTEDPTTENGITVYFDADRRPEWNQVYIHYSDGLKEDNWTTAAQPMKRSRDGKWWTYTIRPQGTFRIKVLFTNNSDIKKGDWEKALGGGNFILDRVHPYSIFGYNGSSDPHPNPTPSDQPPADEQVSSVKVTDDAGAAIGSSLSLKKGQQKQLRVFAVYPDGSQVEQTTPKLTSSKPEVVTVGSDGMITAKSEGSAVLTAKVGTVTTGINVTVTSDDSTIVIDAQELQMTPGQQQILTAEAKGSSYQPKWSSSNPNIASIDPGSGLLIAKNPGTVTITASPVRSADGLKAGTLLISVQSQLPILTDVESAGGVIGMVGLPDGTYTMTEITAPDGYKVSSKTYTFTVANDQVVGGDTPLTRSDSSTRTDTVVDAPLSASWGKGDSTTHQDVSGAVWKLTQNNSADTWCVSDVTGDRSAPFTPQQCSPSGKGAAHPLTDTNRDAGKITVTGLNAGGYTLTEAVAPNGYDKQTVTYKLTVAPSGRVSLVAIDPSDGQLLDDEPLSDVLDGTKVLDHETPGSAVWTKVDSKHDTDGDMKYLAGSEWMLSVDRDYKVVGRPGTTRVKEDYKVVDATSAAQVSSCHASRPSGTTMGVLCDTDPRPGRFKVTVLQWGTWTLTETKQPEGYVMPDPAPTKTLKIGIPDAQIDDKVNGSSSTLPAIDTSSDAAFDIDFGNIPNDQRQYHLPNSGGSTSLVALIVALGFLLLSIGVAVARTARKG